MTRGTVANANPAKNARGGINQGGFIPVDPHYNNIMDGTKY
jgi:hypothetical protein